MPSPPRSRPRSSGSTTCGSRCSSACSPAATSCIESVPGLAKTTAARVVAESIRGGFRRIQCTPDLLPSDIVGTQIYEAATNSFVTQLGPVHANIVLLDEINRSSAKTQSAMLEAMEERQTTIAASSTRSPSRSW